MKKKTILSLVLLVVLVAVGHSAFAASQESYDVSVPAFGNAWSREYLLLNGRLFETRLLASGGKDVAMTICRADTRANLGNPVIVSPSGTLTTLWRNTTGVDTWVVVRLNSVFGVIVTVRAQGIWFWNHQ